MRVAALLPMVGLVAACQQPPEAPSAPAAARSPAAEGSARIAPSPAGAVVSLAGAWRVAGIDDGSFDQSYGLALSSDIDSIWWEPRCAGMARKYRIDGKSVSFTSSEPPRPTGAPTRPVCTIGLPPRLDQVFRALDNANTIVRTPENGVRISGDKHSLLLFSQ